MIPSPKKRKIFRNFALKAGLVIVSAFYLVAIFADFFAPYDYREQTRMEPSAPPSSLHFRDNERMWHVRPFIYAQKLNDARNMVYDEDHTQAYTITFLARGTSYNLFGLIPANLHLFGISAPENQLAPHLRLLGTDQLGRDRFSRLLFAIRFSLLVSPIGTVLACLIGIVFGAVSGYAGRSVDAVMIGLAD